MLISVGSHEKNKSLTTRYHYIRNQIQFSYGIMQNKVASKFHKNNAELKKTKKLFTTLIEESARPYLRKPKIKIKVSLPKLLTIKGIAKPYQEILDWTQGRYRGNVVKITVQDGLIIEKVLMSPKGNLIIVKHSRFKLFKKFLSRINKTSS